MNIYHNIAMLYMHESYGELQNQSLYHTDKTVYHTAVHKY
jgi:hypothetical protein